MRKDYIMAKNIKVHTLTFKLIHLVYSFFIKFAIIPQ